MSASLLAAASFLFMSGAYLSFGNSVHEYAQRHAAGDAGENRVSKTIQKTNSLGLLENIVVESKPGTQAIIDHLVRGKDCLIVVETKNWNGVIKGDERSNQWIQCRPSGQEQVHRNPVFQARRQARIVHQAMGVPVVPLVVMAGRCFPQSGNWPRGVISLALLSTRLPEIINETHDQANPQQIQDAWTVLTRLATAPGANQRSQRLSRDADSRYRPREWLGWTAMAIAAGGAALETVMSGLPPG